MAKTTTRKVARVARTGGGRTKRGQGSWFFPALMTTVVVLGTGLIVMSRANRQPDNTAPRIGVHHWHAALGFDICGTFAGSIPDNGQDPLGIHTHGDGVVHIHPFSSQAAGRRATLQVYFDTMGIDASATEFKLPNDPETHKNGAKCGDRDAKVVTKVWDSRAADDQGRIVTGDPGDIRFADNQLITIALVPDGTEVRRPPSEPQLDNLSDVPGATTTSVPDTTTTSTAPPTTTDP
ncbi:MAG: hypothetical protein ACRD2W_01935 [Acidimicrobiales bacterium]